MKRSWSRAGWLDADPGGDAGQLGIVGDALEVVARGVWALELRDLVAGQLDLE